MFKINLVVSVIRVDILWKNYTTSEKGSHQYIIRELNCKSYTYRSLDCDVMDRGVQWLLPVEVARGLGASSRWRHLQKRACCGQTARFVQTD